MTTPSTPAGSQWTGWQKVLFRFFFIYFLLFIPSLISDLPVLKYVQNVYNTAISWAADQADSHLFHIHPPGVPLPVNDGAGDTSHLWAQLWMFLLLAAVGSLVWTLLDPRRENYERLGYWLRTAVRYFIALQCFDYGIMKMFMMQMTPPTMSQLATPLGDFAPMRLCWMFMGYGAPYEAFGGLMEVVAGLLLLYRPTVTLGLLAGLGVFINAMMLNLSYDVPVKEFAMEITFCCVFLLVWDNRRLFSFLALNKPAGGTRLYEPPASGRPIRIARLLLKLCFIYFAVGATTYSWGSRYVNLHKIMAQGPIRQGVYAVSVFAVNRDTIPPSFTDTAQWKDVIFDIRGRGSVNCPDTSFANKYGYGRGLFHYETDTVAHLLTMTRSFSPDHRPIMVCRYELPDSNRVILRGRLRQDSLYIVLQRTNRQFQLSHWQFHWISESNR
jgi:hypothetical protein